MRTLIDHVMILTMDKESRVYQDGYLLTDGQNIAKLGDGLRPQSFDRYIDGKGGILMPGMINVHSHISMVPFRSMGDDCPDRLRRFLFPLELEAMTPGLIHLSARYAVCELLLAGVTSVLDMYYFEDEVAKACEELGIRGWLGETVINIPTCDSPEPYGGLAVAEPFLKRWKGHDRIHPMVAPHATNTNSPQMLKAAYALAREHGVPYTLHVSEMDYEMTLFREQYNQTPVEFLYDLGVLGPDTIAAHCIHVTEQDLELFARTGTKVAHCIGSNTKGGKGVSPVKDMKELGIDVGLGTDGPSSGNTLDLFTQFRLFASFQKTRYHDRGLFPAKEIVEFGTIGGARVLNAAHEIGSLEEGKRADLVLVETDSVNMFPMYNPYSMLVYSANASNVDSVWVDGNQLVGGGRLLQADLHEVRRELEAAMAPFRERAAKYADII